MRADLEITVSVIILCVRADPEITVSVIYDVCEGRSRNYTKQETNATRHLNC